MTDRISHNLIIESDLIDAGFNVRWSPNNRIVISLDRRVSINEVQTALFHAGYEEETFTINGNGHWVIVDAVDALDQGQCKITTTKVIHSPLTEGINDGI